jgi:hypothetical protein
MRYLRILALLGICMVPASYAHAQGVSVGIGVGGPVYGGPAPICTYGYYSYYPYACAPYGYYGPSWFSGGLFIGAGPWYHGFYGRPGYRPFVGGPGYRSFARGPVGGFRGGAVARGPVGGFRGGAVARGPAGGFRGGAVSHGSSGSFHGGGGSHSGGGHGGGRR